MPETEVAHGLEGIVAFATEIAEPDKEGSALRYRGVDIEEIVGRVPFENIWGLLIDGSYDPGLPPAEAYNIPVHTGDVRVDVQAAIAMLAPAFGFRQTYDISAEQARADLSRVAVMVLSYAAQSARGLHQAVVPQAEVDRGATADLVPEPIHLNDLCVLWIELLIGEVRSEHEQSVAVHHGVVARRKSEQTCHAHIERVTVFDEFFSPHRMYDWSLQLAGEFNQLGVCPGAARATKNGYFVRPIQQGRKGIDLIIRRAHGRLWRGKMKPRYLLNSLSHCHIAWNSNYSDAAP